MKDFTPYGLILGIIIILGLGIAEQYYLEKVSIDTFNDVTKIEAMFLAGNLEDSIINLQNTITKWKKNERILEMMLNHEEVHKISESLIEIDSKLKNFSNSNNVSANFALLKAYITNIEEGNKFIINNVL